MQLHMRRTDAHWDQWLRGAVIVAVMLAAPLALAVIWLTLVRGLLP